MRVQINPFFPAAAAVALALALGLGGGHYPPLAFVTVFFAIYVLLTDPRLVVQPRRWWRPLLVGLASFLLPLAYMPIRGMMGAPQASSGLATLPGFLNYFLARGFAGDMFAFATATDLPHRLALLPTLFPLQFNVVLLAAALLGLLGLIWRDWRLFVLLAGSLVLHTFVTITYRAPQTVEYLMPAYLPIAIAVGLLPSLLSPHSRTPTLLCSHTSTLSYSSPSPTSPPTRLSFSDRAAVSRRTLTRMMSNVPDSSCLANISISPL